MTAPTLDTLDTLAAELARWDGRTDSGLRLRDAVRALAPAALKRDKAATPVERALLIARSAYEKQRPPELGRLVGDPRLVGALGPFLGDPAMGEWPFDAPLLIDDDEAAAWLPSVARHVIVDERIRSFVAVLFRARRRELWLPASAALAKLARRDAAALGTLCDAWQRGLPGGLPERWPDGRLCARRRPRRSTEGGDEGSAHAARHALHLACAWLAEGGDGALLGGLTAAALASMPLPGHDAADASVVLLGLGVLLDDAATRAAVLCELPARAREAPCDPLVDAALRDLADALRGDDEAAETRAAVTSRLCEPRWEATRGAARLDALSSWLATARWFQARGDHAALGEMRAASAEAAPALHLCLDGILPGGGASAVEALLPRLACALDPDVWHTTSSARQATLLAELLLLLERPEVAALPWAALVRRAMPTTTVRPQDGSAAEVAKSDLALLLSARDYHPKVLVRDARFEERVVLHLAASQDGFVARQVAVEIERLLRRAAAERQRGGDRARAASGATAPETPGEAQAKLLWRLMQRDPPTLTFRELGRVLRGSATPLHAVVEALGALDAERDADRSAASIAAAYARLASATRALIHASRGDEPGEPGPPSVRMVEAVAEALLRAASLEGEDVGGAAWLETLRGALFGTREDSGLHSWMRWLGTPAEGLEEAWERFETAAAAAHGAGALVGLEQCRELDAATHELLLRLDVMAWPEADVVRQVLRAVEQRSERWREQARRRYAEVERVTRLLDRGDDQAVLALVERDDDLTLDLLPPEELRRIARFLLLRLRYRAASKLRVRVQARAQLPGPVSHVAPLFIGVSGGTLLVLDVGTAWNEVVLPGHGTGYVLTVCAALTLSLLVLAGSVVSLMPRSPRGSAGRRALASAVRVLPTFVAAFALACFISWLVLTTLAGTATRLGPGGTPIPLASQVVLWGSLSLFLGLFFGLILQGRSTFREG
ncbi:MAG: hypothetical protein IT373_09250 [Polyangiaceae bacterium]|nr:hypothetical protein [Polyangiaceae bacterium]